MSVSSKKISENIRFLIQSASLKDYPSLRKLALKYPLLNLPAEQALLKKKIKISEDSFAELLPPQARSFLFVLKQIGGDCEEVIGSSQMAVKSGTIDNPSYSLKIFEENKKNSFLQLKTITEGPSYLGGLILDMDYRGHPQKAGKQLSLIRFLFSAMNLELFEDTFHAEVAPFLDEKNQNPFFENFSRRHINLSMEEIDYLTLTDKEKLFSSYPRGKILFSSLPDFVQESLGKSGLFSRKAEELLKKQNFYFIGEIDPFDGGPYVQAKKSDIPLIQKTRKVFVKEEDTEKISSERNKKITWLWARMDKEQFKGGVLEGVQQGNQLFISKDHFTYFQLTENSVIFISPFE